MQGAESRGESRADAMLSCEECTIIVFVGGRGEGGRTKEISLRVGGGEGSPKKVIGILRKGFL